MSEKYYEKLKDPRWQKKRLEVFKRDGFKCLDCGSEKKTLHVHHCHYIGQNPWDTPIGLLMTLCEDCHESRGQLESDGKTSLGWIFAGTAGQKSGEDELKELVSSLVGLVNEENPVRMVRSLDSEYMEDQRWWLYAAAHPEFWEAYEAVTGQKVSKKTREASCPASG